MIVRRVKDDEGEWWICREEGQRYNMLIAECLIEVWEGVAESRGCHEFGSKTTNHSPPICFLPCEAGAGGCVRALCSYARIRGAANSISSCVATYNGQNPTIKLRSSEPIR